MLRDCGCVATKQYFSNLRIALRSLEMICPDSRCREYQIPEAHYFIVLRFIRITTVFIVNQSIVNRSPVLPRRQSARIIKPEKSGMKFIWYRDNKDRTISLKEIPYFSIE